jgi:hypothetical protein
MVDPQITRIGSNTGVPDCAAPRTSRIPEVNVTVTSQCPGVSAQVIVSANFNTPDGSYQVPRLLSEAASSPPLSRKSRSVSPLPSGFPVLGVGAVADWADGAHSATLTYEQIACDPLGL